MIAAALFSTSLAASGAASRLGLVPITPGGSAIDPQVYGAGEIGQIRFGIFLDPELGDDEAEAYLRERAELCVAGYGVQLFERDREDAATRSSTLLLQQDDGTIRLDTAALKPGVVYGWRVVVALPDGSSVLSTPLYFSVDETEPRLPEETEGQSLSLAYLKQLALSQRREALALSAYLDGAIVFDTYPTASDRYVCAPVRGGELLPLPAQSSRDQVPPQILPLLGALMQQAQAAQDALRESGEWSEEVDALAAQLGQLLGSVSYGRALISRAPGLGGIVGKLQAARGNPEQAVALLSELRLALDSAIGFGSMNLRQSYQQAFSAYADAAEERLATAANWEALLALYGDAEATSLLNLLNDQRGALALLRDEVARGRLSKSQLAQRLRSHGQRAGGATHYAWQHIDGALCRPMPGAKPSPQLEQELTRCGLYKLVVAVWPD